MESWKEARRKYARKWREANRDHVNEYQRAWRKKNKDKVQQYNKKFYENFAKKRA